MERHPRGVGETVERWVAFGPSLGHLAEAHGPLVMLVDVRQHLFDGLRVRRHQALAAVGHFRQAGVEFVSRPGEFRLEVAQRTSRLSPFLPELVTLPFGPPPDRGAREGSQARCRSPAVASTAADA